VVTALLTNSVTQMFFHKVELNKKSGNLFYTTCSTLLQKQGKARLRSSKTVTSVLQSLTFPTQAELSLLQIYGINRGWTIREKSFYSCPLAIKEVIRETVGEKFPLNIGGRSLHQH